MKKYLILCLLLIPALTALSQTSIEDSSSDSLVFIQVEQMPQFPGGQDGFMEYLKKELKYPKKAIEKEVEGRVFLQFIIDSEGRTKKVTVVRGIGSGCDEEAQRVVENMPRWNPGMHKGEKVNVQFTLPIKFTLHTKQ